MSNCDPFQSDSFLIEQEADRRELLAERGREIRKRIKTSGDLSNEAQSPEQHSDRD